MSMISIHDIYRVLFRFWRRRRFELFLDLIRPSDSETMLDVGGYPGSWIERGQPVQSIDILNVHEIDFDPDEYPDHCIKTLVGDGCALKFDDGSYDIVFSNSVIEHVGSWEKQQEFAAELRRVGGALWVQTPAYEWSCPLKVDT
jgi:ubiquinone/menaquinone biosynthesis C-methylase UbiE